MNGQWQMADGRWQRLDKRGSKGNAYRLKAVQMGRRQMGGLIEEEEYLRIYHSHIHVYM